MRRALGYVLAAALLAGLAAPAAHAVIEPHRFDSPEQLERYRALIGELRCLVCQNQNLADSDADLARDLRRKVHEMIRDGATDDEILAFMVARYGDFVLYRPPLRASTALLWGGPFLLLAIGIAVLVVFIRRRPAAGPAATPEQRARVRRLLEGSGRDVP